MPGTATDIPEVNDLVRVSLGNIHDPVNGERVSDAASRIEDVMRDPTTGSVVAYTVAAPSFAGNLEPPAEGTECWLRWYTSRGLSLLPMVFENQHLTTYGVRVWHLRIAGPSRRDERRQYYRVPWTLNIDLEVRRDLDILDPQRRMLLKDGGLQTKLARLPGRLNAQAVNISEGGLLCLSAEPALPTHLPLITRFTLDTTCFVIPARVVWSVARSVPGMLNVESALAFDNPAAQADILRPLLYEAQLRERRERLRSM